MNSKLSPSWPRVHTHMCDWRNPDWPEYWPDVVLQYWRRELRVCVTEGPHQLPRPREVRWGGGGRGGGVGDDRQLLRIVVQPVHRRGREVGGGRLHALAHCFSAAPLFWFTCLVSAWQKIQRQISFIWRSHLSNRINLSLFSENIASKMSAWHRRWGGLFGLVRRWWRIPRTDGGSRGDTPSLRPLAPEISAGRGMPEWKSDELTITVKSCVQPPSSFNRGYLFLRHEPDLILWLNCSILWIDCSRIHWSH